MLPRMPLKKKTKALRTVMVNFRMTPHEKRQLEKLAEATHEPESFLLRRLVRDEIDRRGPSKVSSKAD